MASEESLKEFPDVSNKLQAPKKLSTYEKERQAAEAKRQKAEEENAAALRAFQDSFADEEDDYPSSAPPSGPRGSGLGYGEHGRGHAPFPSGPRSGPRTSEWTSGMPPPSMKRKRALDEMREAQEARREQQSASYLRHRGREEQSPYRDREDRDDDREESSVPRQTVQLAQLPPDTTRERVDNLLKGYLEVHDVQFQPPAGPGLPAKRSLSALVQLARDTTTPQIDSAVSALRNKYLGCGFYLAISRHLSSAALHPSMTAAGVSISSEPFGAEKPKQQHARSTMRNAPPPQDHRGFAPPESYDSPARDWYDMPKQPEALVSVHTPIDIETVRAIHILVEKLATEPTPLRGMKLEALLMAKPEVQNDERFAFLYDSRSPAGIYYRYLLWGREDPTDRKKRAKGLERVHDDVIVEWSPPDGQLPFMDLASLADVVTDIDYVSSDEESDDEGAARRFNDNRDVVDPLEAKDKQHLTPLKRARLVHLLSRLPTSNARLRKGDIARITNFAINHAGTGAEEIVDILLLNITKPFSATLAAKYEDEDDVPDEEDEYEPDAELPSLGFGTPPQRDTGNKRDEDPSTSKLIALYAISDILSASSTAGARNAWKYRQLFEAGFKAQKTFVHLGRMEKDLGWGKMRAEQWKRKVGVVFGIWEGWSVFSSDVHQEFKKSFFEPPLTEEERRAEEEARKVEEKKAEEAKLTAKFKRVNHPGLAGNASPESVSLGGLRQPEWTGNSTLNEDPSDIAMSDAGQAPTENVTDKHTAEETHVAAFKATEGRPNGVGDSSAEDLAKPEPAAPNAPKPSRPKRMRAEDMFASDEEEA
ncbi:hypothetical protein BAUCODRAFT_151203 [Baudoinia panamericana UAMH 10762]|uniref:CID domain-containing protein n=1 Tax=Baudoinia panamericana (strain UAMH 10762) TaxID=717646 RepID=M2LFH8_BAUPA|nr:uncharacterized protein BAUCODRAFT_151203 [Baudoinia panamericana UAMH 10762]EMC92797.1 hypothetical protein BAUCODRAFT_151203 [Baudoinia panamericana UAMH 10762]